MIAASCAKLMLQRAIRAFVGLASHNHITAKYHFIRLSSQRHSRPSSIASHIFTRSMATDEAPPTTSSPPVPLSAPPAVGQLVEHEGKTYETIREGGAYILIPPNTQKHVDPQAKLAEGEKAQNVFYNPIQQFNRDLSVLSIKAFGEDWMERKRLRNDRNKERHSKKQHKKRKLAWSKQDETLDDGGAQKLRKAEDGKPTPANSEVLTNGNGEADSEPDVTVIVDKPETAYTAQETDAQSHTATNGDAKINGPRFSILDALSATGLRALRYAKEIPFTSSVVANDMNPNATKSMALNIAHNGLTSKITPNTGDAIGHMYSVAYPSTGAHGPNHVSKKYDVIDLDPYGTAAPFINAALQALNDGGLLCVTCTDSGVFASAGYCEKTYSLYGGMPAKGPYCHEAGLRLIIGSIAKAAAAIGIAIEPLLSLSIDFYARTFIRVRKSPADVKYLAGKTMYVACCDAGCGAWTTSMIGRNTKQTAKNRADTFKHGIGQVEADKECRHCGFKTHIAGPMWGGPLHNGAFIEKLLEDLEEADSSVYETKPRLEGMLSTALDELLVNEAATRYIPKKDRKEGDEMIPQVPAEAVDAHPFFFNPSAVSKVIHCVAPSAAAINGALRHLGYRATRSHCQAGSIKTDAPWSVIWEMMREWVRQKSPIKDLKENTPGRKIMADETKSLKVVFDEGLGKDKERPGGKRLVRYQQNPRENWGPMTKAKGSA